MQPTDPTLVPPRHSRAEDIRATLEAEIEAGVLCPGAPLDERELAQRFGVSRTPVREALQQLAAHELVSIAPRQGAAVARLSVGKVRAMLEYVGELESLAARLAARRGDEALHAALDAGLSLGRRVAATPGAVGYAAANAAFHEAIYQAAATRSSPAISARRGGACSATACATSPPARRWRSRWKNTSALPMPSAPATSSRPLRP